MKYHINQKHFYKNPHKKEGQIRSHKDQMPHYLISDKNHPK